MDRLNIVASLEIDSRENNRLIFAKEARINAMEKRSSLSTNDTEQLEIHMGGRGREERRMHVEGRKGCGHHTNVTKLNSAWITDLSVKYTDQTLKR